MAARMRYAAEFEMPLCQIPIIKIQSWLYRWDRAQMPRFYWLYHKLSPSLHGYTSWSASSLEANLGLW
jgi:hypothetical protein